jgi:hypothetical protein
VDFVDGFAVRQSSGPLALSGSESPPSALLHGAGTHDSAPLPLVLSLSASPEPASAPPRKRTHVRRGSDSDSSDWVSRRPVSKGAVAGAAAGGGAPKSAPQAPAQHRAVRDDRLELSQRIVVPVRLFPDRAVWFVD